jgi:archaellum component FlaC
MKQKENTMKRNNKRGTTRHEGFVELVTRLESEAEKLVRRIAEVAEKSSRDLRDNVSDLMEQIREEGITTVASQKGKDLKKLAEQVIEKAREIQFGPVNRDSLIRETRKNIDELVGKVQASPLLQGAFDKARQTKTQVFSVLSIPSQEDVVRLQKKITHLEQRVNKLTRKAA